MHYRNYTNLWKTKMVQRLFTTKADRRRRPFVRLDTHRRIPRRSLLHHTKYQHIQPRNQDQLTQYCWKSRRPGTGYPFSYLSHPVKEKQVRIHIGQGRFGNALGAHWWQKLNSIVSVSLPLQSNDVLLPTNGIAAGPALYVWNFQTDNIQAPSGRRGWLCCSKLHKLCPE